MSLREVKETGFKLVLGPLCATFVALLAIFIVQGLSNPTLSGDNPASITGVFMAVVGIVLVVTCGLLTSRK